MSAACHHEQVGPMLAKVVRESLTRVVIADIDLADLDAGRRYDVLNLRILREVAPTMQHLADTRERLPLR